MSLNSFYPAVITGWFVTLAAVFSTRFALGIPTTLAESTAVVLVGCVPAIVLLAAFHSAPHTATEMSYDTDRSAGKTHAS